MVRLHIIKDRFLDIIEVIRQKIKKEKSLLSFWLDMVNINTLCKLTRSDVRNFSFGMKKA